MDLKPALSYDRQIIKLKCNGLIIEDYDVAIKELSNINYYMLSGYFYKFQDEYDQFLSGYSLEYFISLYKFDNELKNIVYKAISVVEHTLRTRISHCLAMIDKNNPEIHLSDDIYRDMEYSSKAIKEKIEKYSDKRKELLFVSHHINKYDNHFPVWVAIELFSFGDIGYLFTKLRPEIRKQISKEFNTEAFVLESWIRSINCARNVIAHHGRIYGLSLSKNPKLCFNNHKKYNRYSHKVFDVIYLLKILYYDQNDWLIIVERLDSLLSSELAANIELEEIGFPYNWKQLLSE